MNNKYMPLYNFSQQKPQLDEETKDFIQKNFDKQQFSKLSREEQIAQIEDVLNQQQDSTKNDKSSFESTGSHSSYIFLIGSLGLLIGYFIMQINTVRYHKKTQSSNPQTINTNIQGKALIGGDWQLTNTKGEVFGSDNLKGSYYLLYFGFCNCPDICPNSLIKLIKSLNKVKSTNQGKYFNLKTVFVSVDPDRDSLEKIRLFCDIFDKDIIGVTGKSNNDKALRDMMKKFRIYATKMEFDQIEANNVTKKNYTIDHTVLTYLMDDQNNYIAHLGSNLSENDLAKVILDNILENEKSKMKPIIK